ncbi:hypothetical protein LX36DRAFT_303276 [Colletotrichum falcatum]|nr:hypothetical protein LX36DRAFT_303276 [Colletotrichum falcatum]
MTRAKVPRRHPGIRQREFAPPNRAAAKRLSQIPINALRFRPVPTQTQPSSASTPFLKACTNYLHARGFVQPHLSARRLLCRHAQRCGNRARNSLNTRVPSREPLGWRPRSRSSAAILLFGTNPHTQTFGPATTIAYVLHLRCRPAQAPAPGSVCSHPSGMPYMTIRGLTEQVASDAVAVLWLGHAPRGTRWLKHAASHYTCLSPGRLSTSLCRLFFGPLKEISAPAAFLV